VPLPRAAHGGAKQKKAIAADVPLKKRLARKALGELRVSTVVELRNVLLHGAVLERLRSIDAGIFLQ
jgi:hypothetical protein